MRGLAEAMRQVNQGEAAAAFLTQEVSLAEVEAVCHSGAVMPPKSTFFYPKVLGGLLFASVADEPRAEQSVFDSVFWPVPAVAGP